LWDSAENGSCSGVQRLKTSLRFDERINTFLSVLNASFYIINAGQAETTLSWFECKKNSSAENFACYVSKAKQAMLSLSAPCRHTGVARYAVIISTSALGGGG